MSLYRFFSPNVAENTLATLEVKYNACKAVLAERERELLELKGPCSTSCRLHRAHSGPCDIIEDWIG